MLAHFMKKQHDREAFPTNRLAQVSGAGRSAPSQGIPGHSPAWWRIEGWPPFLFPGHGRDLERPGDQAEAARIFRLHRHDRGKDRCTAIKLEISRHGPSRRSEDRDSNSRSGPPPRPGSLRSQHATGARRSCAVAHPSDRYGAAPRDKGVISAYARISHGTRSTAGHALGIFIMGANSAIRFESEWIRRATCPSLAAWRPALDCGLHAFNRSRSFQKRRSGQNGR